MKEPFFAERKFHQRKQVEIAIHPENYDEDDSAVATYLSNGTILLGYEFCEKKAIRILSHELLHATLHKICGVSVCVDFDKLCWAEEMIDSLGCPKP